MNRRLLALLLFAIIIALLLGCTGKDRSDGSSPTSETDLIAQTGSGSASETADETNDSAMETDLTNELPIDPITPQPGSSTGSDLQKNGPGQSSPVTSTPQSSSPDVTTQSPQDEPNEESPAGSSSGSPRITLPRIHG